MASGVAVNPEVLSAFEAIKLGHKHKYVMFRISDDLSEIIVENKVDDATYDDFVGVLPADDCRYAVYDFDYEMTDGSKRSKLIFIVWCPDSAKIKAKMLYAASKDALKKKLVGFAYEFQATDFDEIEYAVVFDKVSAGGTK